MNNKIKNYVEVLFSDIPRSTKANELKEEILSNMYERFEDYTKDGKTENQAYSLVISSLGDIDEMLADVMPNDEFVKQANHFRNRNSKNISIGVVMYIIGAASLIGLVGFGALSGNQVATYAIAGVIVLLVISAFATGLIMYTNMSTPLEYKDYNIKTQKKVDNMDMKHSILLNNILTIYWIIIASIYLVISFITGLWPFTWIIMVVAAVFHFIIKMIFDMKYGNE